MSGGRPSSSSCLAPLSWGADAACSPCCQAGGVTVGPHVARAFQPPSRHRPRPIRLPFRTNFPCLTLHEMDFDFQWLLLALPVAFALGWLASRIDLRQLRTEERSSPKAYFKGLNLLLNEQQDKAIDAFIEA